jgi:hypothetical protein
MGVSVPNSPQLMLTLGPASPPELVPSAPLLPSVVDASDAVLCAAPELLEQFTPDAAMASAIQEAVNLHAPCIRVLPYLRVHTAVVRLATNSPTARPSW